MYMYVELTSHGYMVLQKHSDLIYSSLQVFDDCLLEGCDLSGLLFLEILFIQWNQQNFTTYSVEYISVK